MAVLLHPVSDGVRVPSIAFSTEYERRTLTDDRDIIDRIIAAYHHAVESASPEMRRAMYGTIWGAEGFAGHQGELVRALEERSAERTHDILRQFHVSDAAHGIAMGRAEAEAVKSNPAQSRQLGLMWLDRLVGLAYASGALPVVNPEDNFPAWERALEVDVDEIAAAIERHIRIPLEFPDVTGVFGGTIRGRPIPMIAFTHLLVALNIRAWLPSGGTGHVVEIGGGFGDLALWTTRLVPCRYTIYDLPFASAAQAYFLCRARPGEPLRLSGERTSGRNEVALLPGWGLLQDPPATADVVVNQDSLVEIPRAIATAYLKAMRGFLDGPFLSINHESWQRLADALDRTSVAESIATLGYVRVSRGPFPLRMGYVQEIYAVAGKVLRPGGVSAEVAREAGHAEAAPSGTLHRLGRLFSR